MLQLFGDKIQARALASQSNVPVVRGSGNLTSGEECLGILNNGDVRLPAIMKVRHYECLFWTLTFILIRKLSCLCMHS